MNIVKINDPDNIDNYAIVSNLSCGSVLSPTETSKSLSTQRRDGLLWETSISYEVVPEVGDEES